MYFLLNVVASLPSVIIINYHNHNEPLHNNEIIIISNNIQNLLINIENEKFYLFLFFYLKIYNKSLTQVIASPL